MYNFLEYKGNLSFVLVLISCYLLLTTYYYLAIDLIQKYFTKLTDIQKYQYMLLYELYSEWNKKINVISRKDIEHLYERHILHSLGIAKVISFGPMTRILDVGTGGGFPGIPLAILFPECSFHLVDSIGKKITVVRGIVDDLGLENVRADNIRAEQLNYTYDFVVSRAVTRIKPFLQWVNNKINTRSNNQLDNGILFLKGGDLTDELAQVKKKFDLYFLSEYFGEEFFHTKKVVYFSK